MDELINDIVETIYTNSCLFTKQELFEEYKDQIETKDYDSLIRFLGYEYAETRNIKIANFIKKIKTYQ